MTSWQIYWLTRMDSFKDYFCVAGAIFLAGAFIFGISWAIIVSEYGEACETARKYFFVSIVMASVLFLFSCLIPTTKEMAAIIILPKIQQAVVSNKKLTGLPDKVLGMANSWIEKLTVKESK